MITGAQRKLFFVFVNRVGKEKAYSVLREATKGLTSLRDSALTKWKMSWVLCELIFRYQGSLEPREPVGVKKGGEVIALITRDQRNAIGVLRKILKMGDEEYRTLCKRGIGFEEPLSSGQAFEVMGELEGRIREKKKCKPKG